MPAAYDQYDYPQYWASRVYEHESETIAVKSFLEKVPHLKTIIDIGANIGVTSYYFSRFAKIVYSLEPSTEHFDILAKMVNFNKLTKFIPLGLNFNKKKELPVHIVLKTYNYNIT